MKIKLMISGAVCAGALMGAAAPDSFAQSADALIDKLVEKGILTVKEGNDLREEAEKNFNQAYAVKSGMPDWVTSLKFSGDIRLRSESFLSNSEYDPVTGAATSWDDRTRFRYRLRFGMTATLMDNLEAGFRLTSSDPASGTDGGDPISGNSTFQNNATKKFIYIDQAYLRWYFLNGPTLSGLVTGGKMENPFQNSDMVWDPDYTPEGFALQSTYRLNDAHALKLNAGAFVLDELATSGNDPFLYGAQVRWDAAWSKKLSSSMGVAFYGIQNSDKLTNVVANPVPNQNAGNTRLPDGTLAYDFNPIVVDANVVYNLDSFPLYRGAFPIKVGGEYMNNPAAPDSADNYAWNAGVTFGKASKKNSWELSYAYKWLGANSWWEEVVDSDFGAFYARSWVRTAPGYGNGAGYAAGTNTRGHVVKLAYSPTDSLVLSAKWFYTHLINPYPADSASAMNRLQVDASLKF